MARTKQPAPVRRETSSEYISKHDRVVKKGTVSNGTANGKDEVPPISAGFEKNTGLLQVAIAVGGIYGSLYA
jgi:solute carrier family 35 (UDP-galactose transporter), member B1